MCQVVINTDGETLETPQQLADALQLWVEDLVMDEHYNSIAPNSCLCQVNVERSLVGFDWERGSDGDYRLL